MGALRDRAHNARLVRVGLGVMLLTVAGCAVTGQAPEADGQDVAVPWVRESVEYQAAALQVYHIATDELEALVADRTWSALPGQTDAAELPPAIILDVDETVLDNSLYQERQGNRYAPASWDAWLAERAAEPVPGVVDFLRRARALGVEVFFVTNRRCRSRSDQADACPQERDTLANMGGVGITTDAEHVMLLDERADWGREKQTRRNAIAARYRVVMLFGDQLGDFLPCVRSRLEPPCTAAATSESRRAMHREHANYWGRGWYVLPNPMYGSWADFD